MTGVLVVGVGNRDRADDGVGPAIADRIAESGLGVDVMVREGDLADLPLAWSGYPTVVVVDAAAGEPVGSVTIDDGVLSGSSSPGPQSTHGIGLIEAIQLARHLGRLPERLVLVAVGGRNFGLGGMTTELERALPGLAACIGGFVEDLGAAPAAGRQSGRR